MTAMMFSELEQGEKPAAPVASGHLGGPLLDTAIATQVVKWLRANIANREREVQQLQRADMPEPLIRKARAEIEAFHIVLRDALGSYAAGSSG